MTFPELITLGLSQKIDESLTLLADVDWTRWSRIKQVTFISAIRFSRLKAFGAHGKTASVLPVGGIYRLTENTSCAAGISFDQCPSTDAFRSADLPDSTQIMISAGLTHRFDQQFRCGFPISFGHFMAAPDESHTAECRHLGRYVSAQLACGVCKDVSSSKP